MSTPLPLRPPVDHAPDHRSVIDLEDDDTTDILAALGSETARAILASLDKTPATATDLAEAIGTSLQNVQYHLNKLRAAGLVSEAGTWYSTKGQEMTVYGVACERVELRLTGDPGPVDRTGLPDSEDAPRPTPT